MAAVDTDGIVAADERARLIPADAEAAAPPAAPAVAVAPARRASRLRAGIRFDRELFLNSEGSPEKNVGGKTAG